MSQLYLPLDVSTGETRQERVRRQQRERQGRYQARLDARFPKTPKSPNLTDSVAVGDIYGRLTVVGPIGLIPNHVSCHKKAKAAVCECACGEERVVYCYRLAAGLTKSCGCLQRDGCKEKSTKHGGTGTRLYNIWAGMKHRCLNPEATGSQHYYGRGIGVCEEWMSFVPFRDWSLANGYQGGLELDRINNDGDYESSNCRWVTRMVNSRNTRQCQFVSAYGESKTFAEWLLDPRCNVGRSGLKRRIMAGWEPERAITEKSYASGRGGQVTSMAKVIQPTVTLTVDGSGNITARQ